MKGVENKNPGLGMCSTWGVLAAEAGGPEFRHLASRPTQHLHPSQVRQHDSNLGTMEADTDKSLELTRQPVQLNL